MSDVKEKVSDLLTEEKAKNDASYHYDKKSVEPVAEGAFKGALSSSLASKVIREFPSVSKRLPKTKTETALVGAGTVLGAIAGKAYNDKKVDQAKAAREWLSDKRKKNEYIKNTERIYKEASDGDVQYSDRVFDDKNRSVSDSVKSALAWGVGGTAVGALYGGLKGVRLGRTAGRLLTLASGAKGRAITSGTKLGLSFGAGNLASDAIERGVESAEEGVGYNSKNGLARNLAISGAAGFAANTAIDPISERFIGGKVIKKFDKDGSILKEYKDEINRSSAKKEKLLRRVVPKNVADYIPFGGRRAEDARNIVRGYRYAKNGVSPYKGVMKDVLKRGVRGGLAGAAIMYGLGKLIENSSGIEKKASLNGDDLISAEEARAKNILSSSTTDSLIRKGGLAAFGYIAGRELAGTSRAGAKAAALTAAYSIPKVLYEEYQKHKAREFLKMPRNQKLRVIKDKEDEKKLDKEDLVSAYVGARIVDAFFPPHQVKPVFDKKEKNKFDIKKVV